VAKRTLEVGGLSASPGERAASWVSVELEGVEVQIPVFLINGVEDGPTLGITAGIHGAEYACISGALQMGQTLDPSQLKGRVIVVPIANPAAFWQRSIYVCPLDGKNLFFEFPGREDGSASEVLAHWLLEEVVSKSDYYVDLHDGDINEALQPFAVYIASGNDEVDRASLGLAKALATHSMVRYLVEGDAATIGKGTAHVAAASMGIPAATVEVGGNGFWQSEMEVHTKGVEAVLRHLGMVEGPAEEEGELEVLRNFTVLVSEQTGFYYPETEVGQRVSKGDRIGVVRDYLGNELQVVEAPFSGVVLVAMTSLASNPGFGGRSDELLVAMGSA